MDEIKEIISKSESDTFELGRSMAVEAKAGDIILLEGDLGAGKTVFAKGFAAGLGIDEPVTSPTFTIVHEYDTGRLPLYHFDLYRLGDADELFDIGYEEYFYGDGVCLVEWSQRLEDLAPERSIKVVLNIISDNQSIYRSISVYE